MATTGVWVVARWSVDLFFNTALLQTIPGVVSDLFFGALSALVFVPYFDKRVSGNYRELWGDTE